MKRFVTALEIVAAALSLAIAMILIIEHHTEWALIGTYWCTVAIRNVGSLFRRKK